MKEVDLAFTLIRVIPEKKNHLLICMICIHLGSFVSDKDLRSEGFELESCRSMIALMDVSFSGEKGVLETTPVHYFSPPHTHAQLTKPGRQNSKVVVVCSQIKKALLFWHI